MFGMFWLPRFLYWAIRRCTLNDLNLMGSMWMLNDSMITLIVKHDEIINVLPLMLNQSKQQLDDWWYTYIHTYYWILLWSSKCTFYHRILSSSSYYHINRSSLGLMLLKYKFNWVHLDAPKNESIWKRSLSFENKIKMQFSASFATCQAHIGWDVL